MEQSVDQSVCSKVYGACGFALTSTVEYIVGLEFIASEEKYAERLSSCPGRYFHFKCHIYGSVANCHFVLISSNTMNG